jgi:heat shock protein beta
MMADTATEPEKFEFKAEVTRVMDIIINSLYSEKDVFLRELVSNAADACDKKRFLTLGQEDADDLDISIKADKDRKVLIIEDTGVGMTRDELINNLGKIAQSGTKGFSEMLKKKEAATSEEEQINLIGQFGVGFYSGFLVADKMTVTTKGLEGEGKTHRWESEAGQSYTVAEVVGDDEIKTKSGTRIELSLREDADQYLDDFKLK